MEYEMTGTCRLNFIGTPGENKSELISTDFYLEPGEGLEKSAYVKKSGELTKEGCEALTSVFTMGLASNIHLSHNLGYKDSAEHLRYIISKLEEAFVAIPNISLEKEIWR